MLPDTVQTLELVWTAIAALGAIFAFTNMKEATKDYLWTRRHKVFNGRRLAAKGTVVIEAARLMIQAIFVAIGLVAMTYPVTALTGDEQGNQALFRDLFTYGLVAAAFLLSTNTAVTTYMRRQLQLGAPNDPGRTGKRGKHGDRGPRGEEGPAGDAGAPGPAGMTGPAGKKGATGPPGTAPAGVPGPPGPAGPAGEQGEQGEKGATGADGSNGVD